MKYLIFLFLCVANLKAQTYKFDYVMSYEMEYDGRKHEITRYINSKNFNYVMSFSRFHSDPNQITLVVHDLLTNKNHFYTANPNSGNDMLSLNYQYQKTIQLRENEVTKDMDYDLEIDDKDSMSIKLNLYKMKRKKSIHASANLKVSEFQLNLFPAIKFFIMDTALQHLPIAVNRSVILDSATEKLKNGWTVIYSRKSFEPVNLSFSVPK